MKHENINYLVVGSFVLVVLVAFIVVLGLITGRNGDTENYNVFYDSVAGLKYGTIVSYEGYQLGQVENVEPIHTNGETRYKVTFSIQSGWKIPDNSVAVITSSGLLGGVSIDIKEGNSKSVLPAGGTLTGEEGANLFAAVGSAAGDIKILIKDVREFVQVLNTEAELFTDARKLMARLNNSAAGLESILNNKNQENIEKTLKNFATASNKLDETITEINKVVSDSNSLVASNKDEIQRSIKHLSASLEVVAQHINTIAHNLEGTSRNMNEFSRQIRENPGLLLGSTPPKDKTSDTAK